MASSGQFKPIIIVIVIVIINTNSIWPLDSLEPVVQPLMTIASAFCVVAVSRLICLLAVHSEAVTSLRIVTMPPTSALASVGVVGAALTRRQQRSDCRRGRRRRRDDARRQLEVRSPALLASCRRLSDARCRSLDGTCKILRLVGESVKLPPVGDASSKKALKRVVWKK